MLKGKLANSFAMKDLGATKKILGMRITRDKKITNYHCLKVSTLKRCWKYLICKIKKKLVSTLLVSHFKLNKKMCPKTHEEMDDMSKVPYASTIGSFKICNGVNKA